MAEGDGFIYNSFKEWIMEGVMDLSTGGDVLKMILVETHSPDIDAHDDYTDVSADEYASASGYVPRGATLANQDVTKDNTNDRGVFDGDNITWSSLGPLSPATPSHCILFNETVASPTADPLIAYWELGTTATNGGDYTLQFHTDGIILLT